ncbi:unnamed protein product [Auanema sp. JU1783]|nr:unnamed protein product [Auanema sp. JU1783]
MKRSSDPLINPRGGKQTSLESFLQSNLPPCDTKRKKSQLKMDLYLKWKDPERLKAAQVQREESFRPTRTKKCAAEPKGIVELDGSSDENSREEKKVMAAIFCPKPKPIKKSHSQELDDDFIPVRKPKENLSVEAFKKEKSEEVEVVEQKQATSNLNSKQEEKDRRKILRGLLNNDFITNQKKGNIQEVKKELRGELKEGDVIRKKAQRELMHGTDCTCCSGYYDALELSPESRAKRVQQVSKHKYINNPLPKTPEHYWEIGFPSESEQKKRGLIKLSTPKKDSAKKRIIF